MEHLLEIQNLIKYYGSKSSLTKAVNDISFTMEKGNLQQLWAPAVQVKRRF